MLRVGGADGIRGPARLESMRVDAPDVGERLADKMSKSSMALEAADWKASMSCDVIHALALSEIAKIFSPNSVSTAADMTAGRMTENGMGS